MTARRLTTAAFVLDAASAVGFKIGTDGAALDVIFPQGLDREVARRFSRAIGKYRAEIISLIRQQRDGAAR